MSLEVKNLSKSFGDVTAVDDISFKIQPGIALALLGRNGAGKTTTIRMILDIILKDQGDVSWNGKPMEKAKISVGYLPEERGLYPKSTVSEQLIYFAVLRGMDRNNASKSLKEWLERYNIGEYYNRRLETLSKGNQQKIQIISALLHEPELVILDEPFSGLDPVNAQVLKDTVEDVVKQNKCLLFSSHQMEYVESFCREIIILKSGRSVLQGNLREIKNSCGRKVAEIETQSDLSKFFGERKIKILQKLDEFYKIKVENEDHARKILKELAAFDEKMLSFSMKAPTLHELFVERAGD